MSKDNEILVSLRGRLVNGQFDPGQRLQPEKLRTDYGCSASTLRETLFRLSTEGLVDFQEQRGFRVPRLSRKLQHELTLMRILLEGEGACLSIRLGGVAWEARLSAAHHQLSHIEMRVGSEPPAGHILELWSNAELEFHQTLIGACDSDTLKRTHRIIYNQFRQQLITTGQKFVFIPENVEQHKAILDAALDRDEPLIRRRIHDHLARNLMQPEAMPV
ncbi:MAG: GntR family transcriptional regulator [Rhodobacter sp.]|jgi:DNA-binding GntR family transcriptional regulator|nr:GntR family transcriptional regulator [Rhodobacter sp.]